MVRIEGRSRRRFLKSLSVPAALAFGADGALSNGMSAESPLEARNTQKSEPYIDLGSTLVGDDAIPFLRHTLDLGLSETVAVADMNGDGRLDIVCGENWFEQLPPRSGDSHPRFVKHKFRDLPYTPFYLEDLSDLVLDVNGDGFPDVVSCSYWSKPLTWWENPAGRNRPWREHLIDSRSPVEFAFLVDILNTGKPLQLLPQFGDPKVPLTWYELAGPGAADAWIKHEISPKSYGHGIGAGDVNGDGRTDIITPKGWFEAPADPRHGEWTFHPEFDLGATGFIYALDVNGDGLPDLVTSLGHDYGIFWYAQKKDTAGNRTWEKHVIDNAWSQAHAVTIADLNGDGRPELITGKRYYAHEHDPGANEPLGVYWYEMLRDGEKVQWKRHIIDYSSRAGGGMQIPVADIDGDGDLDFVVAGKSGLFLFENLARAR
ncbi:MAG: VCBS repeat-containing protein [Acidobacteriia bacterium]|nr:VCBS repeat-containing protein [Terriglobia bacterium]